MYSITIAITLGSLIGCVHKGGYSVFVTMAQEVILRSLRVDLVKPAVDHPLVDLTEAGDTTYRNDGFPVHELDVIENEKMEITMMMMCLVGDFEVGAPLTSKCSAFQHTLNKINC